MRQGHEEPVDRDLLVALHRLADDMVVPPADAVREAALLTAFDEARRPRSQSRAVYWWTSAALATVTALLIVVGIGRGRGPRTSSVLPSRPVAVGEFVAWPGARDLPPLESGELLRVDLPVSMLPSLGIVPPATQAVRVRADVIVGQDGLARAVRLVSN